MPRIQGRRDRADRRLRCASRGSSGLVNEKNCSAVAGLMLTQPWLTGVAQHVVPQHRVQADAAVEELCVRHLAIVVLRGRAAHVGHGLRQVLAIDPERTRRRRTVRPVETSAANSGISP